MRGLRTYYFIGNSVKEMCCDGTPDQFALGKREWYDGLKLALTMPWKDGLQPSSKLAVVSGRLPDTLHIVFQVNLGLKALKKIGSKGAGIITDLPKPQFTGFLKGTGLAAVWRNGTARVYFQCDDGFVYEAYRTDGSWSLSQCPLFKAKVGTPLAATVIPSSKVR
jgi:hypothetical protein